MMNSVEVEQKYLLGQLQISLKVLSVILPEACCSCSIINCIHLERRPTSGEKNENSIIRGGDKVNYHSTREINFLKYRGEVPHYF